jgi:hypothetical protein
MSTQAIRQGSEGISQKGLSKCRPVDGLVVNKLGECRGLGGRAPTCLGL